MNMRIILIAAIIGAGYSVGAQAATRYCLVTMEVREGRVRVGTSMTTPKFDSNTECFDSKPDEMGNNASIPSSAYPGKHWVTVTY
jgi:hypothetical protein